jgi:DNA topoisomerase-1
MNLVIVESPTKAATIQKFLDREYKVESSYGHVRDLPKSKLGIDLENNFEPQYIIPKKSQKRVSLLKKEAAKAERVILATDEDREGEAIAWHLTQALNLEAPNLTTATKTKNESDSDSANFKPQTSRVERIVFHEITKSAIQAALANPRGLNFNLINAQQARRVLDRLVGYNLSPFLWKKIARGLSAGRVQSVALRLIVDREEEIKNFLPQEYWTLTAELETSEGKFTAELVKIGEKTLDKLDIKTEAEAKNIADALRKSSFQIQKVEKKESRKNPPPPFTTSTLQQTAAARLGFSAQKTMFLAQELYENGYITYMRTDSVNLSREATAAAKEWLTQNLGKDYALPAPRIFKNKSRLAQEAHEAIRPTDVNLTPDALPKLQGKGADKDHKKIYELIWRRFVASQMPAAVFDSLKVDVLGAGRENYLLRAAGSTLKFDGFLKIWPAKFEEKELPPLKAGEKAKLLEVKTTPHTTLPPPRYNEASLIKTLEEYGIGRPSTYAPIISVIQNRGYVEKNKGYFYPTEIGILVNKVLTENFPEIVDTGFTAKMEEELDEIAKGKIKWQDVIREFYNPFSQHLEKMYQSVRKEEIFEDRTEEKCEKCGKPMRVKLGRFGKFLACSGFPECKNTKSLKEPPKSTGLKCPTCGEGEIIERRVQNGRARGKIFWGCSRYPACDYASWTDPLRPTSKSED